MIPLTKARVLKYKSIEDSFQVDVTDDVTILVGKYESGKTAFLEALHKALPLAGAKFGFVFDYPRKDYVKYRPLHDAKTYAKVVDLTFRIEKDLASKINQEVFHGAQVIQPNQIFTRSTDYGNSPSVRLDIDQKAAIDVFRKNFEGIEHASEVFADAKCCDAWCYGHRTV